MEIRTADILFLDNPNPMWIYDPEDLSITDVNEAACDLYGYSKDEFLALTIADLRPEEEIPKLLEEVSKRIDSFSNAGIWTHRKKDGELLSVRVLSHPVSREDRKLKLVTAQDVTNKVQYQQELIMLLENSLDGILLTSPDGRIYKANRAACRILGMTEEEIIQSGRQGLVYHDKKLEEALLRRKKSGEFSGELTFVHRSGRKIPVELTSSVYKNPHGQLRSSMIFRDISDRKRTEQQLKESVERYHYATKAANDAIYDWDIVGNHLLLEEGFNGIFGYDIGGKSISLEEYTSFVHHDDHPDVQESLDNALSDPSRSHWKNEYRFKKASGEYAQVAENGYIIRDDTGRAIRMIGAIHDVTKQRELERLLDQAYAMGRIGVWELNLKNSELYWSAMTRELHEVEPDFMPDLESGIQFYKEGKSRNVIKKAVKKAIEESVPWEEELQIITAKGNERWVRSKGEPEVVEGECLRLYGIFQDIHEHKESQLESERAYEEKTTILESIGDGFFSVNRDWIVTYWNRAAERMVETPKGEILGKYLWDVFADAIDLPMYTHYHRVMREGVSIHFEDFYAPLNRWYDVNAYPSEDGVSVYFKDITRQKENDNRLQESLKEKETLLAEIHHRVKNNLAVVTGLMQLQAFQEEDESLKHKLDDSISRIKTIANIHELLYKSDSFSRLNLDENIQKLVGDISQTYQLNIPVDIHFDLQKIDLNINQAIPASLIVNEVVTNAFKHAFVGRNRGELWVSVVEENNTVRLQISDNGKGLPEEFNVTDQAISLGIQLIDILTQQLGGSHEYESADGKTSFRLTFEKRESKGSSSTLM